MEAWIKLFIVSFLLLGVVQAGGTKTVTSVTSDETLVCEPDDPWFISIPVNNTTSYTLSVVCPIPKLNKHENMTWGDTFNDESRNYTGSCSPEPVVVEWFNLQAGESRNYTAFDENVVFRVSASHCQPQNVSINETPFVEQLDRIITTTDSMRNELSHCNEENQNYTNLVTDLRINITYWKTKHNETQVALNLAKENFNQQTTSLNASEGNTTFTLAVLVVFVVIVVAWEWTRKKITDKPVLPKKPLIRPMPQQIDVKRAVIGDIQPKKPKRSKRQKHNIPEPVIPGGL